MPPPPDVELASSTAQGCCSASASSSSCVPNTPYLWEHNHLAEGQLSITPPRSLASRIGVLTAGAPPGKCRPQQGSRGPHPAHPLGPEATQASQQVGPLLPPSPLVHVARKALALPRPKVQLGLEQVGLGVATCTTGNALTWLKTHNLDGKVQHARSLPCHPGH
jgi:hypothetical protein